MPAKSQGYETGFIKHELIIFTFAMQAAFKNHIEQNLSFLKGEKILIAISGGIDSVVLTHLMHQQKFSISLAHCNFNLRGKESNKDEVFVKNLGAQLAVPTYCTKFETKIYADKNGISTQMAARELRYNWFQKISKDSNIDCIVTAHQKDDVIETFLINLTRGTGIDGLLGIPEQNGNVVRPLLPFTRNQILVYATKNKIQWREDESNSSLKYVRNKVRHKVVPVLKELNPNLLETFSQTLGNLKSSQQILKDRIENVRQKCTETIEDKVYFNIEQLKTLSNPKIYLYELLKDYGFTEWEDIAHLLDAQTGKQVFSKSHVLLKNRAQLVLSEISSTKSEQILISTTVDFLEHPLPLKFKKISIAKYDSHKSQVDNNVAFIDYDNLEFPLHLRKWQKGDFFYPIGLKGKKKVSKYFKDEKLSRIQKEETWLLCSGNAIVWIIGMRMDDRYKITANTTAVFKIKTS